MITDNLFWIEVSTNNVYIDNLGKNNFKLKILSIHTQDIKGIKIDPEMSGRSIYNFL